MAGIHDRDLKRGRLFLKMGTPIALGREVRVDLVLPSGSVASIEGRVAHIVTAADRGPGVELVLTKVPPSTLYLIESALKTAAASSHGDGDGGELAPEEESRTQEAEDDLLSALEEELQGLRKMNPFQVLNLPTETTDDAVRKSFIDLSKKYHPDLFARFESEKGRQIASDIFVNIRDAYRKLSDSTGRSAVRSQLVKGARRDLTPIFGVPIARGPTPVMGVPIPGSAPSPKSTPPAPSREPASPPPAPRRDGGTPVFGSPIPRRSGTPVHGTPIAPARTAQPPPHTPTPLAPRRDDPPMRAAQPSPKREGTPIRGVPIPPPPPPPAREAAAPELLDLEDLEGLDGLRGLDGGDDHQTVDVSAVAHRAAPPAARPKPPPPSTAHTRVAASVPPPPLPSQGEPIVTFRGGSEARPAPTSLNMEDLFSDIKDLPRATHAMSPINLEERSETKTASDLLDVGKYEEALSAYDEQLRRNPTDRSARAGKELAFGLKLAAAGDKQGAIQHLEAALEIEPWSERTARALNGIRRAQTDTRKGLLAKLLGRGT